MSFFLPIAVLILNNCNNVSTSGAVGILRHLKGLSRFEANKGRESSVQNAISALEEDEKLPQLTSFLFRNPFK